MYAIRSYYEIVLLSNPADTKPGSTLNVQVLLRGKPLPNATVGLTHDGFSKEQDAYKAKAQTDAQGKASFTVDKPVITSYSIHYTKLYDCSCCGAAN